MKRHLLTALAVLVAAGCADDPSPTAPELSAELLPCVFGKGTRLDVGETMTVTGAQARKLCLQAGGEGADYTLVPFLADQDGEARLQVEAIGANLRDAVGPPDPNRMPGALATVQPQRDQDMHLRLMERMRSGLHIRPATAASRDVEPVAPTTASVVPAVGSFITVGIPQFYLNQNPCTAGAVRQVRVSAVTQRAILVNDPTNPAGGLTDAELRAFGDEFDRQIYPVDVLNFGAPTDLDDNGGRVIIVFTREVNALTPPNSGGGYFGGFFFPGDLFPRVGTPRLGACPRSNVGEIFYLLAPDPNGAVNGNRFPKDLVLRTAGGTIAHEFQHLINSARRIYVNNAEEFEEVWLDEALSHAAEEINFYAASGLSPRQNLTLEQITADTRRANAVDNYLLDNLGRYMTYLQAPDSNSVIGPDLLETRGGSWAFLRYAIDRRGTGDQQLFFKLVNNTRVGLDNLSQVLGAPALDWVQDWTLSVYTDDAVPVEARFTQPSWNFRSIMPAVAALYGEDEVFPLKVERLGSNATRVYNLRGGGAAYLRFGIEGGARVGLRLTSNGSAPTDDLRFSLVRTR
jgi:hypothetical protein